MKHVNLNKPRINNAAIELKNGCIYIIHMLLSITYNQMKGGAIMPEVNFDYYHGKESEQFLFFRIP